MPEADSRKRLLLVEDNPGDARLFQLFCPNFVKAGLRHVLDGESALAMLERACRITDWFPNVIVLDLNLPGFSGLEILRKLKASPALRHIPVVIFTSSQNMQEIQECYEAGASAWISKPADLEAMERTIRSLDEFWSNQVAYADPPANSPPHS